MQQCEGVIPEATVVTDGVAEAIPEHPCEAEATTLSRSMRERRNRGEVHWIKTGDTVYCESCFRPGTMIHLDGTVTQHPAMSVE